MSNYLTVKQIVNKQGFSTRYNDKKIIKNEMRRVQKKAKKLMELGENLKKNKKGYQIHKSLLNQFIPVYNKWIKNVTKDFLKKADWTVFATSTPKCKVLKEKILIEDMTKLSDYLVEKTQLPIKIFYVIEYSPKVANHLHYFIHSDYHSFSQLRKFIKESFEDCDNTYDNDLKYFDKEQQDGAVQYLHKGDPTIRKRATHTYFAHTTINSEGINNSDPNTTVLVEKAFLTKGVRKDVA